MSTVQANRFTDSSGGVLAPISSVMRNRIINGAMVFDQRRGGASVTPTASGYTLDRWRAGLSVSSKFSVQQNAGAVTPPAGFKNYLGVTSLSSYTVGASEIFVITQAIEGFNTADLDFGTANAKTVTLSFWVRSSLTGTFGGSLANSDGTRSYPFSYTISAANTWEQKSITIVGDTSGTWVGATNGSGLSVLFGLGVGSTFSGTAGAWAGSDFRSATGAVSVVGTNDATFYITGVQLEVGTQATSFEYRQYTTELQLCQRYYYKTAPGSVNLIFSNSSGFCFSTTQAFVLCQFPVSMRGIPSALEQSGTASDYQIRSSGTTTCSAVPTFSGANFDSAYSTFTVASGLTTGQGCIGRTSSTSSNGFLAWSAEL
jgi:hypothetical protein